MMTIIMIVLTVQDSFGIRLLASSQGSVFFSLRLDYSSSPMTIVAYCNACSASDKPLGATALLL